MAGGDQPEIDPELVELLGQTRQKPQQLDAAPPFPKSRPKPQLKTKPKAVPKAVPPPKPPVPVAEDSLDDSFDDSLDDDSLDDSFDDEPPDEPEEEPDPPPREKPPIVEPELEAVSNSAARNTDLGIAGPIGSAESITTVAMTKDEPADKISVQVQALLQQYGEQLSTIIGNYAKDRDEIDKSISLLDNVVRTSILQKGASPYVDAWVRLLATKAEINTNATSSLDSIAKLLAAGKSNDLIVNIGGVQKGALDLEALLSQPKREDEK